MAGLGWEFVETAAEDFRGEAVGGGDVPKGGPDVGACDRVVLERALVLVEQGDGVDKCEVLLMVAAGAGAVGCKAELAGIGIDDSNRFQQPLGVLEEFHGLAALFSEPEALQRAGFALHGVDTLGLFAGLVHTEDEAAVGQFLVEVGGGGGDENGDGTFDAVLLGFHSATAGVLAGAGDGEFLLGLEELERVSGLARPLFFDNGEDFVLEIALGQVIQTLAGHGGVFDTAFRRKESEHGVHKSGFAGGAGGLDEHPERFVHEAGGAGQVGGELV